MLPQTTTYVSEEEYFALLANSDEKLEFHDGEIITMSGAQLPHNIVVSNLIRLFGNCLLEEDCLVLNSDMLVHLSECYKYVFPDVVIVCKEPILTKKYGLDVLENPEIVVEVLSDSTEMMDRTEKFDCYKTVKSIKEYVLVSSKKKKVEVYRRTKHNEWLLHDYLFAKENIKIGACEFLLEDIYRKVIFTETEKIAI
jgi:Uma2 family endonuclease